MTLKVCPDEFPNRFCGKTDEIEEGIILRWIVLFFCILIWLGRLFPTHAKKRSARMRAYLYRIDRGTR